MSNAWKELQERNKQGDKLRKLDEREYLREFLYSLPFFPAIFMLTFSSGVALDVVSQVGFLREFRDLVGPVFTSYLIVFAYVVLIALVEFSFYRPLGPVTRIVVAWLMWAWFYYSTWVLADLRFAFVMAFVAALFMIRIVGWLTFCYTTIREGVFLGKNGRETETSNDR